MKACIMQPPYSRDTSFAEEYFQYKMNLLDSCDETMDIIVLPEYSDVPCATVTREETLFYHKKYIDVLLKKCKETAKRCNSLLFVNTLCEVGGEYRNTTYVFDKNGEEAGKYFKRHIPPVELDIEIGSEYTYEFSEPYVLEIDGLRYGFLTCYDFYFYEAFPAIARKNVDIIIGCSLQRSDSHDAIETMCRFLAYNTNAYVIRSSVSFDEKSEICGASMVVSPKGKVLENMRGKFGMATVWFDPADKLYKPAGFGNPDAAHYEYIEFGRNPWQYRPAGSAIVRNDNIMPYPRVCAHRGFSTIAPENSMPAFGAAVAMGADEIEFDLWLSKDGEWVSIHDYSLDRVSDGTGNVFDYTVDELKRFDCGIKFSEKFEGLRILTFEEILKKFSCHVVMNIHIKSKDEARIGSRDEIYTDEELMKLIGLIDKYDCRKYVYFMSVNDKIHKRLDFLAPDICRCMGENFDKTTNIVDRAIAAGCKKVQLFKPHFTKEMIDKAHAHGIKCNMFWSDDKKEAREFLEMGIDTILTNDYNIVAEEVKKYKGEG